MTAYALRNPNTGRIIRLSELNSGHGETFFRLSEDARDPYWKVASLADLIATYCEDRPDELSNCNTPAWGTVTPQECQAIRFRVEVEYDTEGGEPVSRTEWIESFEIGGVYDLRPSRNRTQDIAHIHYGIMQNLFRRYDMDKIETMSLAIVWHSGPLNLRGDIGVTHDKGPSRIVGIADLPDDWPLTVEQIDLKPFEDAKCSLILLDTAELESWLDFDDIDPDNRLTQYG